MLTAAYHMLKNGVEYDELTDNHLAQRDRTKAAKRLVKRLEDLGFAVTTSPIAA
jgi:transposase